MKPANAQSSQNSTFSILGNPEPYSLYIGIYYLHISSRYSHEMTLSSVKITFTVLSSLIVYIGKCENTVKVELKFNSLIYVNQEKKRSKSRSVCNDRDGKPHIRRRYLRRQKGPFKQAANFVV